MLYDFKGIDIFISHFKSEESKARIIDYKEKMKDKPYPTGRYADAFVNELDRQIEEFKEMYKLRPYYKIDTDNYFANRHIDKAVVLLDALSFYDIHLKKYDVIDTKEAFKEFLDQLFTNLMTFNQDQYEKSMFHPDDMWVLNTELTIRNHLRDFLRAVRLNSKLSFIEGKIGGDSSFNTAGFYI